QFDEQGVFRHAAASEGLQKALERDVPELLQAQGRTAAQSGLNIEGLERTDNGHLLVGLRSPTVTFTEERPDRCQEDALVLRITNPDALFSGEAERAVLEILSNGFENYHERPKAARPLNLGGQG